MSEDKLEIHYTVVGFLEAHRAQCDGKLTTFASGMGSRVTVCSKCASVYQYRPGESTLMECGIVAHAKPFESPRYPEVPVEQEVACDAN